MDKIPETLNKAIANSLDLIEQDREREIIIRRYGLTGKKETLEQIGQMLNITRERVRQLEKATFIHLEIIAEDGKIAELPAAEKIIVRNLTEMGRVARTTDLCNKLFGDASEEHCAALLFIAGLSPNIITINENDHFESAIAIKDYGTEAEFKARATEIVTFIKKSKTPQTLEQLDEHFDYEHPSYLQAVTTISKDLATLNGLYGLANWPAVNPKNIRDKIYFILNKHGSPMHYTDIDRAIKSSDFKRKDVTTQAIHNELIKDSRFVLIGRGIYALEAWGYVRGTVADAITRTLNENGGQMERDELIKKVMRTKQVKETTVLLNLQNRKLFQKIGKSVFTLAEGESNESANTKTAASEPTQTEPAEPKTEA